jgi:trimeric autotransporter adhesin
VCQCRRVPRSKFNSDSRTFMKKLLQAAAFLLLLSTLNSPLSTAQAQGTVFTYQGRLNNGGSPATGLYDFQFVLSNAPSGGSQIGSSFTSLNVGVTNGLFTTALDFGSVFNGQPTWLGISVRTNGGSAYVGLTPLQPLTPAPYAIFANTASNLIGVLPAAQISGSVPSANFSGTYGSALTLSNSANQISGAFIGNGANVTNVNAATLGGINSTGFWKTNGNTGANPTNGAFLGTADNLPLEFKVNGQRDLRLEYAFNTTFATVAPNVIGGNAANMVSNGVSGAFIGGGGTATSPNRVGGDFGAVLGGRANTASGSSSTAMGFLNVASGSSSTAMGNSTLASGSSSTAIGNGTIASGNSCTAMGSGTTASGINDTAMGEETTANGGDSTAMGFGTIASGEESIAMGEFSVASAQASMAMGSAAQAVHPGTFVWADNSAGTYFGSTAPNQFLIRASGGVGINTTNPVSPLTVKTANSSHGIEQTDGTIRMATYVGGTINGGYFGTVSNHKLGFYVNDGPADMTLSTNGFIGIGTTSPTHPLQVITAYCDGSSWVNVSDRNLKQNFADLDAATVLEKIAGLPIQSWSYKTQPGEKHIGPVAQDFQAAFGLGDSDRSISTVDESGVALAAIQGLNQKLEEQKAENAELRARLEKLEAAMQRLAANK